MAKSGSANGGAPRAILLVPLVVSFLMYLPGAWGWYVCDATDAACSAMHEVLSWSILAFPLSFTLVLAPLGTSASTAIVTLLDLLLIALVWRTQPARLGLRRLAALLAAWAALSAAAAFATPYLMVWSWQALR